MIRDPLVRLYDDADLGGCVRCGLCCMAYEPVGITADEADRLGREFCQPNPGGYRALRMRKVSRSWLPSWAQKMGCCVFLWMDERGYRCTVQGQKPEVCRSFQCQRPRRAAELHYLISRDAQPFRGNERLTEALDLLHLMKAWSDTHGTGMLRGMEATEVSRLRELVTSHSEVIG